MRYDCILADPPWQYRNVKTGGSHTSGAAQKYPTLGFEELVRMPIPRLAARDSVLFLWATTPLGGDPYALLTEWDYVFKTEWYWHKVGKKGTGYWTRGCVEKILIGIRGNVKAWRSNLDNWVEEGWTDDDAFDGVFESKPEGHSRKPAVVRRMIEFLTPGATRVELFATERPAGWDAFGLALDSTHDFREPAFWDRLLAHEREDPDIPDGGGWPVGDAAASPLTRRPEAGAVPPRVE